MEQESQQPKQQRPVWITLHAILMTLVGFFLILLAVPGLIGIVERQIRGVKTDSLDTILTITLMFVVSLVALFAGMGLLQRRNWGRILAIIATSLYLLWQLYNDLTYLRIPFIHRDYTIIGLLLFLVPYTVASLLIILHLTSSEKFVKAGYK